MKVYGIMTIKVTQIMQLNLNHYVDKILLPSKISSLEWELCGRQYRFCKIVKLYSRMQDVN